MVVVAANLVFGIWYLELGPSKVCLPELLNLPPESQKLFLRMNLFCNFAS